MITWEENSFGLESRTTLVESSCFHLYFFVYQVNLPAMIRLRSNTVKHVSYPKMNQTPLEVYLTRPHPLLLLPHTHTQKDCLGVWHVLNWDGRAYIEYWSQMHHTILSQVFVTSFHLNWNSFCLSKILHHFEDFKSEYCLELRKIFTERSASIYKTFTVAICLLHVILQKSNYMGRE